MDTALMGNKQQEDFLKPMLDLMNRRMDEIGKKVDDNTALTQQAVNQMGGMDGRLKTAERNIRALELRKGKKLNISPNTVYLLVLGAVILLAIVASLLRVNLKGFGL